MAYPSKLSIEIVAAAAVDIVRTGGLPALGVRPVADRLGVRPSALYRYCVDVDGLLALVADAAAAQLLELAQDSAAQAHRTGRGPAAAFDAMAQAYVEFAAKSPGLYAAITRDTSTSAWAGQPTAARKALWNFVLRVVATLTGSDDDTDAAVATWSFLHGFADLRAAGLFGASGPKGGFARGVKALRMGLAQPAS
jgi:AcrR family transcriptional regulator